MSKESKLYISRYNDIYGKLLTPHQNEMIRLYYDCDISLFEISEQLNISRQAVRDTIKRAELLLIDFEERLQIATKTNQIEHLLDDIDASIDEDDCTAAKDLLKKLRVIVEENNGII